MKKTKLLAFSAIFILITSVIIAIIIYKSVQSITDSEEVHFHAAFLVYENNNLKDFSEFKYMHISRCSEDLEHVAEDPQLEKAHLHDNIGNIVHVHRKNATWGDLFFNIRYDLPQNIMANVNGIPAENILERKIQPYDRILIYYGEITEITQKLTQVPDIEEMRKAEARSESCGN
ncbi:MAG TPA: hypothetical protein VJC17_00565 [Candidatus Dojkabacteria bacterium]|nr:hypothetical protein [Candidatus Dojkabacteria bacterium]